VKRVLLSLAVLGCVAAVIACGAMCRAIATGRSAADPVYTVAALQAKVARHPTAWRGRTVLLRAVAVACVPMFGIAPDEPLCLPAGPIDPGPPYPRVWLPLTVGAPNPLLAVLRRLPLAGPLVPAPQALPWGAVSTFHVQLRAAPSDACSSPPCYAALLLSTAP
jgi:hypothetical protein